MRVVVSGHEYRLNVLDGTGYEYLKFVQREGALYPGNRDFHPGTTSQEVLRALVNRAEYVNNQMSCWQTKLSIKLMQLCVWLYEHRAARRHGRKPPSFDEATYGLCCKKCGHVGCNDHV